MTANQKGVMVTSVYIAGILYLAHLGSKNVNMALTILMLTAGSIIVAILGIALCRLISCLFEDDGTRAKGER